MSSNRHILDKMGGGLKAFNVTQSDMVLSTFEQRLFLGPHCDLYDHVVLFIFYEGSFKQTRTLALTQTNLVHVNSIQLFQPPELYKNCNFLH